MSLVRLSNLSIPSVKNRAGRTFYDTHVTHARFKRTHAFFPGGATARERDGAERQVRVRMRAFAAEDAECAVESQGECARARVSEEEANARAERDNEAIKQTRAQKMADFYRFSFSAREMKSAGYPRMLVR